MQWRLSPLALVAGLTVLFFTPTSSVAQVPVVPPAAPPAVTVTPAVGPGGVAPGVAEIPLAPTLESMTATVDSLTALTDSLFAARAAPSPVRIRDMARLQGAAPVRVMGYGLVVGLPGTGDQSWGTVGGQSMGVRSIMNLLRRFQIDVPAQGLRLRNVAAVMVTGEVSPYARSGGAFDVTVASLGDATSLAGGTLLLTPLLGEVGGEPIGTAQGAMAVPGYVAGTGAGGPGGGMRTQWLRGPTRVMLPAAGQATEEFPTPPAPDSVVVLTLRSPSYEVAQAVEAAIRGWSGDTAADMLDPGAILLRPQGASGRERQQWLATMDTLELPLLTARRGTVIWHTASGLLVGGNTVRVAPASVTMGGITVSIPADPSGASPTLATVTELLRKAGLNSADIAAGLQALQAAGVLDGQVIIQ
jgi:flagellar P-ring protein precursor FlgI